VLPESQLAPAASGEQLPVGVTTLAGLARGRCEHWRARPSQRLSARCRSRGGPEAEADPTVKKAHHTATATERVRPPVPAGRQLPSRTGHASSSFPSPRGSERRNSQEPLRVSVRDLFAIRRADWSILEKGGPFQIICHRIIDREQDPVRADD
jgi:hypothetical protein